MKKQIAALMLVVLAPAVAAQTTGSAGGYLVHERIEAGRAAESGLGFGVKGHLLFNNNLLAHVELQDAELTSFRIGGAVLLPASQVTHWSLGAALVDKDVEDGFGLFGGIAHDLSPQLALNGQLGYLLLGDVDGLELTLGGGYKIDRYWTAFADLRLFQGSVDGGGDVDSTEFRFGAAYNFAL